MPWMPHTRVVTRFELGPAGSPLEEASCTLNFAGVVTDDAGERQDLANDLLADWRVFVTDSGSKVTNHVAVTQVRLYQIGTDGRMDGDPIFSNGISARGATTSSHHPWQCSMAVTLVAGASGKGRFGRIFLPPQGFQIQDDGGLSTFERGGIFTAVTTLLENLSDKPGIDLGWKLCVAGSTGATGTLREVTAIKLGRVCDTQRRRRRSLDEAYAVAAFSG